VSPMVQHTREVLYNIITGFSVVRLIKMCFNETRSRVRIDKCLSDTFPIQNRLKEGDLSPLLLNTSHQECARKPGAN
jgi:hypothetical protein